MLRQSVRARLSLHRRGIALKGVSAIPFRLVSCNGIYVQEQHAAVESQTEETA